MSPLPKTLTLVPRDHLHHATGHAAFPFGGYWTLAGCDLHPFLLWVFQNCIPACPKPAVVLGTLGLKSRLRRNGHAEELSPSSLTQISLLLWECSASSLQDTKACRESRNRENNGGVSKPSENLTNPRGSRAQALSCDLTF